MEEVILNAFERTTRPKIIRENGFVPGVIYGDSVKEATSVQFEEVPLKKVISKHGTNAKVYVVFGESKKFGFIKEIQRHPISAKLIHIAVQLVSKEHEIKLQLPIIFNGEESLTSKKLQLHIYKAEIDVFGKMAIMPDSVSIDLSEKELGYSITINDFDLDKQIKVTDKENEVYGIIAQMKELPSEVEAEEKVVVAPEAEVKA
ncbi:MAG TPA: 50S ribosomal protein L25 [Ruminiclostridium sp.]